MRFTRRRRGPAREREAAELNITAFMNLMVVLVPFLLITAVFTRTAVLELSLPAADNVSADQPPPRPQISLYQDRLQWSDGRSKPLSRPRREDGAELLQLREWLLQFRSRRPESRQALLLVAGDVDYESLIEVMDAIRSHPAAAGSGTGKQPLFPDISLGDAPQQDADGGDAP